MSSFPASSVLALSRLLRDRYPDALFGFLGNSLAICGVADRFLAAPDHKTQQHLIPFSDSCVQRTIAPQTAAAPHWQTVYRMSDTADAGIAHHSAVLAASPLSPDRLIPQRQQLVVFDKSVYAEGLVSYGYVWSMTARKQGFQPAEIARSLVLCPVFDAAGQTAAASYTVTDPDFQQIGVSGLFGDKGAVPGPMLSDVLTADRAPEASRCRLTPSRSVACPGPARLKTDRCDMLLGQIYTRLAENQTMINLSEMAQHPDDFPVSVTAARAVAGLIIT